MCVYVNISFSQKKMTLDYKEEIEIIWGKKASLRQPDIKPRQKAKI